MRKKKSDTGVVWVDKFRDDLNEKKWRDRGLSKGFTDHHPFYLSTPWRNLRARHLEIEPICRCCWEKYQIGIPAAHVDHIIPIVLLNEDKWLDEDNLQSLCEDCHNIKTGKDTAMIKKERKRKVAHINMQKFYK